MSRTDYDPRIDIACGIIITVALLATLIELPTITQWVLTITGATP